MATQRASVIAEVGLRKWRDMGIHEDPFLRVIYATACMLDRALPEKKPAQPRNGKDFVVGQEMLAIMKQKAPDAVLWDPAAPANIRGLGVAGRQIGGDPVTVAAAVGWWLKGGGLSWMRDKPTLTYVVRNYGDLVARSRESSKRAEVVPPEGSALDRLRNEGDL